MTRGSKKNPITFIFFIYNRTVGIYNIGIKSFIIPIVAFTSVYAVKIGIIVYILICKI